MATPSFISQIVSFFQTALTWVTVLAIPAVGVTAGWHALMRSTSQDEMTALSHSKGLRNTVMYGGVSILAGGIVSAILSQFH